MSIPKALLTAAGFASLSAGVIGIFVPILPTTPFFLIAGGCFLKSSKRLYRWLTVHRVFGPYIDAWCHYHAVTKKSKIISIALLWIVMLCTMAFAVHWLWLRLVLSGVALAVTAHLLLLKTLTPEMLAKKEVEGE